MLDRADQGSVGSGKPFKRPGDKRHRYSRTAVPCIECGQPFYPRADRIAAAKFCNHLCRNANLKKQKQAGAANHNWRGGITKDMSAYMRDQRERHAEKWDARKAVHEALRKGTLVKLPCEKCGSTTDVESHHHKGYAPEHWLTVQWFCTAHHGHERRGVSLPKKAETLARLGLLGLALLLFTAVEAALCAVMGGLG